MDLDTFIKKWKPLETTNEIDFLSDFYNVLLAERSDAINTALKILEKVQARKREEIHVQ